MLAFATANSYEKKRSLWSDIAQMSSNGLCGVAVRASFEQAAPLPYDMVNLCARPCPLRRRTLLDLFVRRRILLYLLVYFRISTSAKAFSRKRTGLHPGAHTCSNTRQWLSHLDKLTRRIFATRFPAFNYAHFVAECLVCKLYVLACRLTCMIIRNQLEVITRLAIGTASTAALTVSIRGPETFLEIPLRAPTWACVK